MYAILLFGARPDLPLNTVFKLEDYNGLKEYWKCLSQNLK